MKISFLLLSLIATFGASGCTAAALGRHAFSQQKTPSDIRYREILDNLAMVACDPAALPAYTSIFAGTAQITDNAQIASTTTFGPPAAQVLSPQLTRTIVGNWTLDPLNTPEKLEAIRCACNWVLFGEDTARLDSVGMLLLLSPEQAPFPGRHFDVADRLATLPGGWVHVGCKKDVPRGACYCAHYGGTSVWVLPEDQYALSQFTLILQDIARVDINSPTLQYIRPTPSDFSFPTKPTTSFCGNQEVFGQNTYYRLPAAVIAEVSVDSCGRLTSDTPYYRWRTENAGSDANLRSQINAAAAGLH